MNAYEREDAVLEGETPLTETPPTVEELKTQRDELVTNIQSIEGQLSQKDRRDDTGERMGDRDFHEWRGRAVTARKHLLAELREVKSEIAKLEGDAYASSKQEEREQINRIEAKLDLLLEGEQPQLEVVRPREFTREEATEMAKLAWALVEQNEKRSPTSIHATLGENDAMFNLKWRLNRLFELAAKGDEDETQ